MQMVLSKVMHVCCMKGKEPPGRVWGAAFGAAPSKVSLQAIIHSNAAKYESKLNDLQNKCEELKDAFFTFMSTHEVICLFN